MLFLSLAGKSTAQTVQVVKFDALDALLKSSSDTTYVINFWATWCKPCVHELPGFCKMDSMYKGQKIKLILISMDFVKDVHSHLEPFLKQKKMMNTVWLLNDPDYNAWIDKVDPSWGGSLPATLVFNNKMKKRTFHEEELTFEELNNTVKPYITAH